MCVRKEGILTAPQSCLAESQACTDSVLNHAACPATWQSNDAVTRMHACLPPSLACAGRLHDARAARRHWGRA